MRFASIVCAVAILASPVSARGEDQRVDISLGLFGALPTALEIGQVLGGSVGAAWHLGGPFELGAHVDVGSANESNFTFKLEHVETRAMIFGSVIADLGAGGVGATLRVGGVWVHETRARHETARVERAGLVATTTSDTGGPVLSLDLTARLHLFGDFWAHFAGGPSISWVTRSSELVQRIGWSGRITAVYRLW